MQRLAGACLLIFANKTDVDGCMDEREILTVRDALDFCKLRTNVTASQVITARGDSDTSVARFALQCHHRKEPKGGTGLGCRGRKKTIVSLLSGHA